MDVVSRSADAKRAFILHRFTKSSPFPTHNRNEAVANCEPVQSSHICCWHKTRSHLCMSTMDSADAWDPFGTN